MSRFALQQSSVMHWGRLGMRWIRNSLHWECITLQQGAGHRRAH